MTVTIKSEQIGRKYVAIGQDKFEKPYFVEYCEQRGGGEWYLVSRHWYSDMSKAKRRFNTLLNRAREEQN